MFKEFLKHLEIPLPMPLLLHNYKLGYMFACIHIIMCMHIARAYIIMCISKCV